MDLRGVVLDLGEDRLEDPLLAAEVVVERALGHPGPGDDRVEAGPAVPVLGELCGGDLDQGSLGGGGVLLATRLAGDLGEAGEQLLGVRAGHSGSLGAGGAAWCG